MQVMIVDDHAVVRRGVRAYLEALDDMAVAAEAADGQGRSDQEIAGELVISERPARTHVSHVLRKLQLTSRTQAALVAVREGLVPPLLPRPGSS